jgi:hypothetical protein
MSFATFIGKVTQQVGFSVRDRSSAVVRSASVSNDVRVKITVEEQWKAVLQVWQNR